MLRLPVVVAAAFLALLAAAIGAAAAAASAKEKKRIGLYTASLPWLFGPYQNQMYQLSLLLDASDEPYDICWLSFAENVALPPGEIAGPADDEPYRRSALGRALPNAIPPGDGVKLGHITFLGRLGDDRNEQRVKESSPTSHINALASQYNLDIVITLMDINRIIPDVPLEIPVVGWMPLHSTRVTKSSLDYWALQSLHGVAALAPGSASDLETVVGTVPRLVASTAGLSADDAKAIKYAARSAGKVAVEFIPHIIDRPSLLKASARAMELLRFMSVAHVDSALNGKNQPPVLDRGQERTLETGHDRSLFGNLGGGGRSSCDVDRRTIDSATFVVLLQGGNYDGDDRKGWDTSVQAFVLFYNQLKGIHAGGSKSGLCASNVHLLIHSIDSYLVEADAHGNAEAPAQVMPKGHIHHKRLHETGLPRHIYTIDITNHAPDVVAAFKQRASVCLHPSKVEGFGMNVLECQALGTPVVTTNYTAMADYTLLGRAVPHRQTIKTPQGTYEMALPDVEGTAHALMQLYGEHIAMASSDEATSSAVKAKREAEVSAANRWIDSTFSSEAVGAKFLSLIPKAGLEFRARSKARDNALRNVPSSGAYRTATGYHATIADWDAPWTLLAPDGLMVRDAATIHRLCWETTLRGPGTNVMALPVGGQGAPLGEDTPLLAKTYMVAGFQMVASRRISLVGLAMQQAVNPQFLPQNLAVLEKDPSRRQKDEL